MSGRASRVGSFSRPHTQGSGSAFDGNPSSLAARDAAGQVRAPFTAVDGPRLMCGVRAWDDTELIEEGSHDRVLIDVATFLQDVEGKTTKG